MKKGVTKSSKTGQSVRLVRKANNLVEGKYRFDIWEMRVFTKMLTMIHPDDEDFKEYRIFLKDVINEFDLASDKQSYKLLKDGATKLTKKEIKVIRDTEEGEKEFLTHIAVGMDSFTDNGQGRYIDISFHPKMKPFLLQLQTQFLMYDVRNVLKLQSSFSVRIYELLKQYEKIGKRRFTITELKETLDVADKYPLYANFKQRVILKAQEDLGEHTDIKFTFEEEKRGKAVHAVIFFIQSNRSVVKERTALEIPLITLESPETDTIFEMVESFKGANATTVKDWLTKYEPEYIKQRINLVKNQISMGLAVRNPMGFLQRLMQQPNLFDPIENAKQIKKETTQKNNASVKAIREKEQELETLKINYYQTQTKIIATFFQENESIKKEIIESLKFGMDFDKRLSIEENLVRPQFLAAIHNKVRERYGIIFGPLDEQFNNREKNLKKELKALGWIG
jgi:plasmid replication initiation protein